MLLKQQNILIVAKPTVVIIIMNCSKPITVAVYSVSIDVCTDYPDQSGQERSREQYVVSMSGQWVIPI